MTIVRSAPSGFTPTLHQADADTVILLQMEDDDYSDHGPNSITTSGSVGKRAPGLRPGTQTRLHLGEVWDSGAVRSQAQGEPFTKLTGDMSAMALVYIMDHGDYGAVLGYSTTDGDQFAPDSNTLYELRITETPFKSVQFYSQYGDPPTGETLSSSHDMSVTGRWYHVGFSRISNVVRLYVDGVERASNTLTTPDGGDFCFFKVGGEGAGTYPYGLIQSVIVYNVGKPASAFEEAAAATLNLGPLATP